MTLPHAATPETLADSGSLLAAIARVRIDAPFTWLAMGLSDLYAARSVSLFYGVAFAGMGWAIVFFCGHAYSLTVALLGGFMLLGPALATGFYGLSRQREAGQVPRLQASLTIWRVNLANLGIFAMFAGAVFLIWVWTSLGVFAVFYSGGLPTADDFLRELLAFDNVEFVIAYLLIGSGFAAFIFSISVVAVPLMLDRGKDAIRAMLLSLAAVARNPLPMLVWAALIVTLAGIGFATAFAGLIVTIPVLGHATWHAYRALIPPPAD